MVELLEDEPELLRTFARRHHDGCIVPEGDEARQVVVVHCRERKLERRVDGVVHQGHVVEPSLHVSAVVHQGVDQLRAFVVEMVDHHLLAAGGGLPVDASEVVAADELTDFLKLGGVVHGAHQAFAHLHVVFQAVLGFAFAEVAKFRIDFDLGATTDEEAALPASDHGAGEDIEVAEGEVSASVGSEPIGELFGLSGAQCHVSVGKGRRSHVFRQFVEGKNARREPRSVAHHESHGVFGPEAQARIHFSPALTLEGEQREDRIEHKGRGQEHEEDERQRVER